MQVARGLFGKRGATFSSDWMRAGPRRLIQSLLLRRALRPLSYVLLAGLVGVLLLVATATVLVLFGYNTYAIKSGSMEPDLREGSVAVTSPTSPRALKVGDIIAWRSSSRSPAVLHRIVAVTYEDGEPRFVTQGDQNRTPDATPVALAGPGDRMVYSVPYAGYILNFAQRPPGRMVLIGIPLALLVALFVREELHLGRRKQHLGAAISPAEEQRAAARPAVAQPTPEAGPFAIVENRPPPALVRLVRAPSDQSDLPAFLLQQLRERLPSAGPAPEPLMLKRQRAPAGAGPPGQPQAA